jgi:limonene-1,2-epoxide hydrolase
MNDLERFFRQNTGRLIHKWNHYFEIYDRHFSRFRGKPVQLVEFGVSQGGSLRMWRDYFGPQAMIVGVDINEQCRRFEESGVRIEIGDQGDRAFLRKLAETLPAIDILIDDGGHTMEQQIRTFEQLFAKVAPTGVYLVEDLHTSYWADWGGGVRRKGTFIEYSKDFIDRIHAWHSRQPDKLAVSEFTRTVHSLHYYDSILVIEKRPMDPPTHERIGQATIVDYQPPAPTWGDRIRKRLP